MSRLVKTLIVLVVLVAAAAFAGWYFLLRSTPAPKAAIKETPTVSAAPGGTDGTWTVKPGDSRNFVGYRVVEKLVANVTQTTATGRTDDVTGTLKLAGATADDVTVSADLRTLTSDKSFRDGRIREEGLESDRFPEARFVLTSPIAFGSVPAVGTTITAQAAGDFTLHGVTKRVTIPIQARWDGKNVQVVGSLPIAFADYGITAPTSNFVASVEDHGTMEFQLFFVRR